MNDTLGRRIRTHRGSKHHTTQTALPFAEHPSQDAATSERASAQARRRGPQPASDPAPQTDLFDEAAAESPHQEATAALPVENVQVPEIQEVREPEPHLLNPEEIMLQQVDARNLRPTDRADSYLYHVTNGPDAELALRQGLVVSASDPVILTERQGVSYWLSALADDYDYILDGPAAFVVLRLRRLAVEALLELDPHASRSAACPCFLLTGGAAARTRN